MEDGLEWNHQLKLAGQWTCSRKCRERLGDLPCRRIPVGLPAARTVLVGVPCYDWHSSDSSSSTAHHASTTTCLVSGTSSQSHISSENINRYPSWTMRSRWNWFTRRARIQTLGEFIIGLRRDILAHPSWLKKYSRSPCNLHSKMTMFVVSGSKLAIVVA